MNYARKRRMNTKFGDTLCQYFTLLLEAHVNFPILDRSIFHLIAEEANHNEIEEPSKMCPAPNA